MVSTAGEASDPFVCFDIVDGTIIDNENILTETLTEEEKEEMYAIVKEFDHVNSRELIDFTLQETPPTAAAPPHHKVVRSEELDRLTDNNTTEQTKYQTKWAIAVFKGIKYHSISQKSTKKWHPHRSPKVNAPA